MPAKTLLLLRHAKSSWKDAGLDDVDRPLKKRGREAASLIGSRLAQQALSIDSVLCSTATRTRETAELMFTTWEPPPPITYLEKLYLAAPDRITAILNQTDSLVNCVLVIAHNPGLEELLGRLASGLHRFPTAAFAHLELDVEDWSSINEQTRGRLIQLWRPRELE